jgi:prepilin-type N-terminal cleavage/methylation domain-containing protein
MIRGLRTRSEDRDAGLTLVEVLLAVAILGIGVTAIVGGMMTSIKSSDMERRAADGQTAMRAYAEAVAGATYAACASSYTATGFTAPAGFSASMTVTYWNASTSSFGSSCTVPTDSGLQKVALTVAATDGRATETLTIAKRKP